MAKTRWRIQRHSNIYLQSTATPGASIIVVNDDDDDNGNGIELQSNKMKRMKCMGQPNNNKGFQWMISYWTIGILVGLLYGYIPSWPTGAVFTSYAHIVALTTTIGILPRFLSLYTNYGRQRSIIASLLMAIMNGVCETMIYVAVYDIGAVWLNKVIGGNSRLSPIVLGFITFNMYSYLIRMKFWGPKAYPKHMKADNEPFYKKGLPEVTLMSISWLILYATTHDIGFVCVLHCIFNFCGAMKMGLQLPSFLQ